MVDARLHDGSRINAAIRPVAVDGPLVSIRKFAKQAFDLTRLVENSTLKPPMAALLREAVKGRLSMLVSGGTGSGKTTLLNALSRFISNRERIITIEDAAELQLQQPHVGRLETRPPNLEGKGEIRQRELVKNALRMRPDRILIGDVRGEEAFDMLNAMNTGHEGSLTTIHANSARDAIVRLEQMVAMAGLSMSENAVRAHIASAIKIIVQMQRLHDGQRKITSIHEITGLEGSVIQMQELYRYVRTGADQGGKVRGEFRATGLRPSFLDALVLNGANPDEINLDPGRPL
jgi:pilus assembly protein CpaF